MSEASGGFSSHMEPIEAERQALEAWKPETDKTTWQTAGKVGGGIAGLLVGGSLGVPLMYSRSGLTQLVGVGVSLFAGLNGAGLGAKLIGGLTHRLDGQRPDADKVVEAHQRTTDRYADALDDAERAVRAATTDEQLGDAWGDLMEQRPDGLPVPDANRGGDDDMVRVGDYSIATGYGVVPGMRYGG